MLGRVERSTAANSDAGRVRWRATTLLGRDRLAARGVGRSGGGARALASGSVGSRRRRALLRRPGAASRHPGPSLRDLVGSRRAHSSCGSPRAVRPCDRRRRRRVRAGTRARHAAAAARRPEALPQPSHTRLASKRRPTDLVAAPPRRHPARPRARPAPGQRAADSLGTRATREPLTPPHQPSGYGRKCHVSAAEPCRMCRTCASLRCRGARGALRRGANAA